MTTVEALKEEFADLAQEFIDKHDELGMRASGNWAGAIEYVVEGDSRRAVAKILGEKYTEQLVFGRKEGKFPPVKQIEQWIYDKGITPIEENMKISSLAFLIARKIAEEGTKYYQQGGTDLLEAVYSPKRIQQIIDKVREVNLDVITKTFVEQLKAVA